MRDNVDGKKVYLRDVMQRCIKRCVAYKTLGKRAINLFFYQLLRSQMEYHIKLKKKLPERIQERANK